MPYSAIKRIERNRNSGLTTSLLSIGGSTGIESVGFAPVGEVMGSCVMHIGFAGLRGCGYGYGGGYRTSNTLTSRNSSNGSYGPYVRAIDGGYTTAIERMVVEAQQLGAHGVIDVRLTVERRDTGAREFIALGTAVRGLVGPATPLPSRPFTTQLSGTDVTRALRGGWVPVSIVVAISVGVRHDDAHTRRQLMTWSNTEVVGYTDLITTVRHEAREIFRERVGASGASRAYVTEMNVHAWAVEPSNGHRDHLAESIVLGGGLLSFTRGATSPAPTSTLTMLSLRTTRRTT